MLLMTKELEKRFAEVGCQDGKGDDALVIAKFFTPDSSWTWLATEYDPDGRTFFGYVIGLDSEWGYFSLDELERARGPLGLHIERDLYFEEQTVRESLRNAGGSNVRNKNHQRETQNLGLDNGSD